jgi:hypothetical protein
MGRAARHEIGVQTAHLSAIEQGHKVLSLVVWMTSVKHMRSCLGTYPMTFHAVGDAHLHVIGDGVHIFPWLSGKPFV